MSHHAGVVIPFPDRIGRFNNEARHEMMRWHYAVADNGWGIVSDGDLMISHTDAGNEYIVVTDQEDGWYIVGPSRAGWRVETGNLSTRRMFRSLRDALEALCPTLPAAPVTGQSVCRPFGIDQMAPHES